jgi:hypothetical protein
MATPFVLSPRGGTSSPKAGAAAARTKEGYGSYAKLLNRHATSSLSSGPSVAALVAAAAAAADGSAAAAGVQDSEAGDAAAAPVLSVQGGCLADQGAMQWAAAHSKEVVAMAAQSHVAVSAGLDGYLKVKLAAAIAGSMMRYICTCMLLWLPCGVFRSQLRSTTCYMCAAADLHCCLLTLL